MNSLVYDQLGLKEKIQHHLSTHKAELATEAVVEELSKNHHFKTIANDKDEEVWFYHNGIYKPNGKMIIKHFTRHIAQEYFSTYLTNQVVAKIIADNPIEQKDFFDQQNENPFLLPVKNGILDIKTKQIYEFTPEKYFFSKINATYDPKAKCDNFINFLKQILATDADVKTIQEILGFCLLRDYKYEKGFMFYGKKGRNGKSKLLSIFEHFISLDNISSISLKDIETEQFSLINLHNKLVNISGDLSEHVINDTGMYKKLTGRDKVSANRKGRSHVQFTNYAKMIFATNDLPIVKNFSSAFSLRWVMVNFPYQFLPQNELDILEDKSKSFLQNEDILDKLITDEEMSGILNFALEGFDRLQKQKKFSNETNSNEVRKYWLRTSNSVAAFVEDMIVIDYESHITKHQFRKVYHDYCKQNNIKQLGDKAIIFTLSNELGVTDALVKDGDDRLKVWKGIKLKTTLYSDNTQIVFEHIQKYKHVNYNELKELLNDDNLLDQCLRVLEREGVIYENPRSIWRLTI